MAQLIRWTPFRPGWWDSDFFEEMDRPGDWFRLDADRIWSLPLDVVEQEGAYVVRASIPGIDPDDLDITFNDNMLAIRGESMGGQDQDNERYMMRERRYGSFARTISFPSNVDGDGIEASYEHGELVIRLPKADNARLHRINVGRASRTIDMTDTTPAVEAGSDSHGWAEGQATTDVASSESKRGQQHWAEGQKTKPAAKQSPGDGFAEGQATEERARVETVPNVSFAESQAVEPV